VRANGSGVQAHKTDRRTQFLTLGRVNSFIHKRLCYAMSRAFLQQVKMTAGRIYKPVF
jgi:hypothetical protein